MRQLVKQTLIQAVCGGEGWRGAWPEFAFLTTPHPRDADAACSSTILCVALVWLVM